MRWLKQKFGNANEKLWVEIMRQAMHHPDLFKTSGVFLTLVGLSAFGVLVLFSPSEGMSYIIFLLTLVFGPPPFWLVLVSLFFLALIVAVIISFGIVMCFLGRYLRGAEFIYKGEELFIQWRGGENDASSTRKAL